ncbi:hypothetical protein JNUCC1_03073 [Lentibacillus sp. JNUCC-1]|uniref:hypothetical protein n=1 Tax=Lentibacillus sp. JNUCC-1 TaxID=2654513 RepID=UPI0012E7CC64|nr:hypothetical protein [Lentibacillus sp. JNUCC-1]MUV39200.1 hypothetical protein [Lentibacillus sp. JNUCC-1]
MRNPLKYTWHLYTSQFEKILLLMVLTTLPLLLLHSYTTNYIYAITPTINPVYSVADIYYALITILLFIIAQTPYVRFVFNEYIGKEPNLGNTFYVFLVNGFTVFVFALLAALVSTIGFTLFVLPGLAVLALLFPVPYISMFDEKSTWKSFKEGIRIGKKHFWKLLLVLLVTGLLEGIFGVVVVAQIFKITNSFAAQILTQMTLNLLIFPFVVMYITSLIIKWRESQEVLEMHGES